MLEEIILSRNRECGHDIYCGRLSFGLRLSSSINIVISNFDEFSINNKFINKKL